MENENATQEPQKEVKTAEAVENTESATVEPNESAESEPAGNDNVDSENTENEGSEPQEEKQGHESKVVRELKEQRRKRQELERELAYLKGLQAAQQPIANVKKNNEDVEPSIDDFEDWTDYEKAKDAFVERKVEKRILAKLESKSKEQEVIKQKQKFNQKLFELQKVDPDKYNKIYNAPISNNDIVNTITGMDYGIDVAAYLADHPDEAIEIDRTPGPKAFLKLGKIEERLKTPKSQPQTKKISQVADPIKPVSSNGGALKKDPANMSMEEYAEYRKREMYGT